MKVDATEPVVPLPEFDEAVRCKDHPDLGVDMGYGLAGGGIGYYTYCSECGKILTKTQQDDENED